MGVIAKIKFSDFSIHPLIRGDFKYINYKKNIETTYPKFIKVKECIKNYYKGFAFKSADFEMDSEIYVVKGDMFKNDFTIDYSSSQFLSLDFYDNEKYKKFKISKGDVIVSLVGSIGKMVIVTEEKKSLLNQNNIALQVDTSINDVKFFAHTLKKAIKELADNVYKNSGYSFLAIDDLFEIKLPLVSLEQQKIIVPKIIKIENEIKALKTSVLPSLSAINQVFSNHFKINLDEIDKIENTRFLSIPFSNVKNNNSGLRASLRWNKMQYIQNTIYSKIDCIKPLGRFIRSTKNGWSPLSVEGGEGLPVLGQEHFSSNTILKIAPSKSTEQTRNNIEDFFIKKGDFFVSRGNTVDLVALASIVEEEIDDEIIYPDLYIKIEFDESKVHKEYLAFLFNSFIGRLYFKYVAKGKNQTMVKVSSAELLNFRVPIPGKEQQVEIVEAIKTQLEEQKAIDKKIEEKQQVINKITEDAVKQE
ncbi:MAG: restriction endonuclease subunit S [Bacteroidota bacterium]